MPTLRPAGRMRPRGTDAAASPLVTEENMGGRGAGTLLLVEDEDRLRDLVAQFLRGEGFRVVEASDGLEGVDRFADSGPFDLVLVDLNLPVFSGFDRRRLPIQWFLRHRLARTAMRAGES